MGKEQKETDEISRILVHMQQLFRLRHIVGINYFV